MPAWLDGLEKAAPPALAGSGSPFYSWAARDLPGQIAFRGKRGVAEAVSVPAARECVRIVGAAGADAAAVAAIDNSPI